jgi:hypothetical protein
MSQRHPARATPHLVVRGVGVAAQVVGEKVHHGSCLRR